MTRPAGAARPPVAARVSSALALALALVAPASASAEPTGPVLAASMQCDRAIEPGRVRCSVEAHVDPGSTIAWADVALVALPEFAAALRGRVGPADATGREPTSHKWAFGLVARRAGQGEARAHVRAVVCAAPSAAPIARCAPVLVEVHAVLSVGG